MMYVSQIIMLYTLNLYNAICQLYLNETGIFIYGVKYGSNLGFPGGTSGKEPACQCRTCKRRRFDSWVGKIARRRAWQSTPIFLPGESHGQRSLVGYSPRGHKESDMTEWLTLSLLFHPSLEPTGCWLGAGPSTNKLEEFQNGACQLQCTCNRMSSPKRLPQCLCPQSELQFPPASPGGRHRRRPSETRRCV